MPCEKHPVPISPLNSMSGVGALLAILWLLTVIASPLTQAQTFIVLHDFTGREDGSWPATGLTLDAAGNLYGTASNEGAHHRGTVYKLSRRGPGWVFSVIYAFPGGMDGSMPGGKVTIAQDGSLYGVAQIGGDLQCGDGYGCGTVYHLRPSPRLCGSLQCPWIGETLYRFHGGTDGMIPFGEVTFDQAGNLYGTTSEGGIGNCFGESCGTVYQLAHSGGSWTENVLYRFAGGTDGYFSYSGLVFDQSGNLYGTTSNGGSDGCGTVFKLTSSQSGWTESILHSFHPASDGCYTGGAVIFDPAGNLYGDTEDLGPGNEGTVFKMTPSGGGWSFDVIDVLRGQPGGPPNGVTLDSAGNLYGTTYEGGDRGFGSVFKLVPSGGGWTHVEIHDLSGGSGGSYQSSGVTLDADGNLYGVTRTGGAYGFGIVWEIKP